MLHFRTGKEFEKAVFDCSSGEDLFERLGGEKPVFGQDIANLVRAVKEKHPPTKIGECLYRQTARALNRLGVDAGELVFCSSLDTRDDLYNFTDGFFSLLSIPAFVTLDLFNASISAELKEAWIASFSGQFYREEHYQSDLFNQKEGYMQWKRKGGNPAKLYALGIDLDKVDFRPYASGKKRPCNHFILTPYDVGTYRQRRKFAQMVARCFAKAVKELGRQNLAQQSP